MRVSNWTQIYWGTPCGEVGPLKPTVRLVCGETEKHQFWHGINLGEFYFDSEKEANEFADRVDAWLDDAVADDYFFCDGYVKRFCARPIKRKTQLHLHTVVIDKKPVPKDEFFDAGSIRPKDGVYQFVYDYVMNHQFYWTNVFSD